MASVKVTFLLPTGGRIPVGGYRVVYRHASELARRGHRISILHRVDDPPGGVSRLRRHVRYWKALATGEWRPNGWCSVDSRVQLGWCLDFTPANVGANDIVVATAWVTAECAKTFPRECGERFYFVQDYEHFMSGSGAVRERIARTYRHGFTTLAISPACEDLVLAHGGAVHARVPNGLDHSLYRLLTPVDSPLRDGIGFPCRDEPFKRTGDAIDALARVRLDRQASDCRYWTFGTKRPRDLPRWIEFHERPTDEELVAFYNRSRIFLVPSDYEGWGLPGSEAMCCGAALVSTDNGGVRAYAEHEGNALLTPPRDVARLAESTLLLLADDELRTRLANAGHRSMQRFTWEHSADAMEKAFMKHGAASHGDEG